MRKMKKKKAELIEMRFDYFFFVVSYWEGYFWKLQDFRDGFEVDLKIFNGKIRNF